MVHFSFLNSCCVAPPSDNMTEKVSNEIEITGPGVPNNGSTGLGIG